LQLCVQRAFRQQPPNHIDELKSHEEGVRDRAGAEQARDHGIAKESEQSRGKRAGRYREERADHWGFYGSVGCDRPRASLMAATGRING